LNRPSLQLVLAINRSVRRDDEWFDEPDDLERVRRAPSSIDDVDDPITAAAMLAFRMAHAQAFGEADKRTAMLLAPWVLDRNGLDGSQLLPPTDREFADLLIKAAAGRGVEAEMVALLRSRVGPGDD
jgi:prophage maintenance system killer protein